MREDYRAPIAVPLPAAVFRSRRRKLIAACLTGAVVLVVAGYFTYRHYMEPIRAREALDDAKRLVAITRYPQAILACSRAILLQPNFADAYWLRAQAYAAQRNLDPAESDYSRLIQLEPSAARGYLGRCQVHFENKDFSGAISDCGQAIQIDPSSQRAFNVRGLSLRALGDLPKSLDDLNHAVELAPNIDNLFQRGAIFRALGKYHEAIADFDQAAFLFPGNPEVYRARAEAKRAMGDEAGAQADYKLGKSIEHR